MRSLLVGASLAAARLRTGRVALLAVATLVSVTSFIFTAAPVLFERAADAGLRDAVASASPVQRDLQFSHDDRIDPAEEDPMGGVVQAGEELSEALPPSLARLVGEETFLVETTAYGVLDAPVPISRLTMRYQSGIDERIKMAEGRAPTGSTATVPVPGQKTADGQPITTMLVEVALSRRTAEVLQVGVGRRLFLIPEEGALPSGLTDYAAAEVVGIFDVIDPQAEYWLQDFALERPSVEVVSISVSIYRATALISPEAYPALYEGAVVPLPFRYAWRYFIEPADLGAAGVATLARDITRLQSAFPFRGTTLDSDTPSLLTGLAPIVERFEGQRRTTEVALSVAAIGPAGASAAALALVAILLAHRRRASVHMARDRGASRLQLLAGQLVEGLLVSVPSAFVGYLLAVLVMGGGLMSAVPAALVALGTVLLLLTAANPMSGGASLPDGRQRSAAAGVRPQRLVFEILLVVVAAVGAMSLLGRGVGTASGGASGSVDPFLAAVPLLIGLAVGLVILRLYALPLRLLAAVAGMARGLVPALALRNASRGVSTARLPLLVLLLVTAMGVFSSVLLSSIERGQNASAWQAVGADYRVEVEPGSSFPDDFRPAGTPGMEAAAEGVLSDARFDDGTFRRKAVQLLALDLPAYAQVVADTPMAISIPSELILGSWQGGTTGTDSQPVPAIVSRPLASRNGLRTGDAFELFLGGQGATARIAAISDRFPGVGTASDFVIAPREAIEAAFPGRLQATTVAFLRGPASAAPALRDRSAKAGAADARILSRAGRFAELHDAPLVAAVTNGFAGALAVALAYSALAMGAGLTLALGARRPQLALLRTLGLRRRQMMGLILLEHAPMVIVALLGGIGLGLAIATLLSPGLGLVSFTGGQSALDLAFDPLPMLLLGVAPVAVVAVAVLGGAWLVQRSDLARIARTGDTT